MIGLIMFGSLILLCMLCNLLIQVVSKRAAVFARLKSLEVAHAAEVVNLQNTIATLTKEERLRLENLQRTETKRLGDLISEAKVRAMRLDDREAALDKLAKEKGSGYPTLAKAYAEYCTIEGLSIAEQLRIKRPPAVKASEVVISQTKLRKLAEGKVKQLEYLLEEYKFFYPDAEDLTTEDIEDILDAEIDDEEDPVSKFLSKEEYAALAPSKKNQLALDRYWTKKRSPWKLGRDYERYIGYLFEKDGWQVEYFGATNGKKDLGRDLIAKKNGETKIIQCKHWSSKRGPIREKYIFQLMGSVLDYSGHEAERTNMLIEPIPATPVFVTSGELSHAAQKAAAILKMEVLQRGMEVSYPCIKCNVTADGGKIYHLPIDQQYDRVKIIPTRGESFVSTVAEAEALGFRRAYRWKGN